MAQFARPDGTVASSGNWRDQANQTTNIYQAIDESTPSDADYVYVPQPDATVFYEASLSNVTDPNGNTAHVLRYRQRKNNGGGRAIDVTVELREGATVRASWANTNISDVASTVAQTLTSTQADSITDYSNLSVRVRPAMVGNGSPRDYHLTWVEFEVPDSGTPPVVAGQSSESDSATAVSRRKLRAAGQSAAFDSATAVVRRKARTAGQVAASESVGAVARGKSLTLGWAAESDSAGSVSVPAPVVVGAAVEQGSATLVGRVKSAGLTAALESGSVFGLVRVKLAPLGSALEPDSAGSVGSEQPVAIGRAVELGSTPAVSRSKLVGVAGALASASASAVSRVKAAAVVGPVETGLAGSWVRVKLAPLGQAGSVESSQSVSTAAGPVLLGQASEFALAAPVERLKRVLLASADGLDAAESVFPVLSPFAAVARPRLAGLAAVSGRLGLLAAVSGRLGASADQIGSNATISDQIAGFAASSGRLGGSATVSARLACSAAANRVSGSVDYM